MSTRLFASCFVLFLLAATCPAHAVSVQLRSGDLLSGDVVANDGDGFKLRRWDNGGVVTIAWEHLAIDDARRMRKLLALPEDSEKEMIDIVRIQTRNGSFLEGRIVEETPDKISLRTREGTKHIPASSILKREPAQVEVSTLYTPREYYDERAKGVVDTDPSGQFDLGSLCMRLGLWAEAETHFTKALELDPAIKDKVDQRMSLLARRRREADAVALTRTVRDLLDDRKVKEARASFDKLKTDYAELVAKTDLENLESDLLDAEKGPGGATVKAADDKLFKDYLSIMSPLLKKPAADRQVTYDTAKAYVEQVLHKEVVRELAKRLKLKPEEFEERWKARAVSAPRKATYGEGTWVIEGRKLKKKDDSGGPLSLEDLKRMQESDKIIEDLWSKDRRDFRQLQEDWWKAASADRRLSWLEAYAAEKLFTVESLEWAKCRTCSGKGLANSKELCRICQGVKTEKVVNFK